MMDFSNVYPEFRCHFHRKRLFVKVNKVLLVNVRATIVMIRIEVFGLEYVYSVILYFAIASPNSKWPSCSLSAKSQVARFKNFTFRDGKIILKGTGLAQSS